MPAEPARKTRNCVDCGRPCKTKASIKEPRCAPCRYAHNNKDSCEPVRDAATAPPIPDTPKQHGDWVVTSDWHIPYHDPRAVYKVFEAADLLGIKNLCIAGDFIHVDAMSKFTQRSKQPTLGEEIVQAKIILGALEKQFDRIEILPGNHDHRVEKSLARMAQSVEGAKALQMIGALVGLTEFVPEDVALSFFDYFFASKQVKVHSLSDMEINGAWVVQHPGSARKVSPQAEREFCSMYRKSVLQGHSHLFAVGFDASGQDVAFNIGRLSDDSKFRYQRERPRTFPKGTLGFAVLLTDPECPEGRVLPVAVHDRWFDLGLLAKRLNK